MLIYFLTFNIYEYAFPLFLIYSFDNDDMKSSKRHVVLLSLIFLLKAILFRQQNVGVQCEKLVIKINCLAGDIMLLE